MPKEVSFYIAEHRKQFPGVQVVSTAARSYPFGRLAAQVLGYTGLIDAEQYAALQKEGYGPNDIIGTTGLESVYEPYLRGERGKQKLIVNADGETIQALGTIPPTPGDDLALALDARVQRLAEKALAEGMDRARAYHDQNGRPYQANAGAVVVLDANTGGVVAMVSNPSFDPSWYVHGLTPRAAEVPDAERGPCAVSQSRDPVDLSAGVDLQVDYGADGDQGGLRHHVRVLPV